MITASGMSGDALDRRGQAAITIGDQACKLVDLLGRVSRRLDLDPAADAIEDRVGVEGVRCRRHIAALSVSIVLAHGPKARVGSIALLFIPATGELATAIGSGGVVQRLSTF